VVLLELVVELFENDEPLLLTDCSEVRLLLLLLLLMMLLLIEDDDFNRLLLPQVESLGTVLDDRRKPADRGRADRSSNGILVDAS
jgi:hypothetical protein